jgi:serine/threonine protein kinase
MEVGDKLWYIDNPRLTPVRKPVYSCARRSDGQKVAIKIFRLHKDEYDDAYVRCVLRESSLLKSLSHPNIVRFEEFFFEDNKYYLVLELMEGLIICCTALADYDSRQFA